MLPKNQRWVNVFIFCILIAAVWMRVNGYGDLHLSVSNPETGSYIESSTSPLFSWKIFSGKRLFTTNIIYKMANDKEKCPMAEYSSPSVGKESLRVNQPCFDKIVLLQNFLSIFGWVFLAWMTARWLKNPFTKIAAVLIIALFGFTPQIAEWDSILSPESLSLSIFMIHFALLMEIAFRVSASEKPFATNIERLLFFGWIISFLLWVFIRDVHLYAIPVTLAAMMPLLLIKKFRTKKHLAAALVVLSAFFIIGFLSAKDSLRATHNPVLNAIDFYIWPHPQRVEFFKSYGIPERTSPEYQAWADVNATKAYGMFLASHPGFVFTTLWEYIDHFKSDFVQPYYKFDMKYRDSLLIIGEMVHPQTASVFVIDLLLLFAMFTHALKNRNRHATAWAWLAICFLAIAAITLVISFFGDIYGTRRHIMPSVEMLRLFQWIFLMPFLDLSLAKIEENA